MLLWVDCQQFRVFVDTYMFNAIKKDHKGCSGLPRRTMRIGHGISSKWKAVSPRLGRVCSGMGFRMLGSWRGLSRDLSRRADWRAYLPVGPNTPPYRGGGGGARLFSMLIWRAPSFLRAYATAITTPPISTMHKRLALIEAHGYTGQALMTLLSDHPHLDLIHISSPHWNRIPRPLPIIQICLQLK